MKRELATVVTSIRMKASTFEQWEKVAAKLGTNKAAAFEIMVGEWAKHFGAIAPEPEYTGPVPPSTYDTHIDSRAELHKVTQPDGQLSVEQLDALRSVIEMLASIPIERLNYFLETGMAFGAIDQAQQQATNRSSRLSRGHPVHNLIDELKHSEEDIILIHATEVEN